MTPSLIAPSNLARRAWAPVAPRLGQAAEAAGVAEDLRKSGAIVNVQVSQSRLTASAAAKGGKASPAPQTAKGMVDTGASISTVSEEMAAAAGLQPTGSVNVGGVGGTGQRTVYAARFSLPDYGVDFDPIEIAGVSIPMPGVQVLIGRDILARMRLDYEGPRGVFSLTSGEKGAAGPERWLPEIPTPVLVGAGLVAAAGGLWLLGAFDRAPRLTKRSKPSILTPDDGAMRRPPAYAGFSR